MTFPFILPRAYRPCVLSYQTSASDASDLSTYSFASVAIGTAAADRYVIVGIALAAATPPSISSVTIGGVTATLAFTAASPSFARSAFYIANVPTGTTATISITLGAAASRAAIGVWTVTGLSSATPTATASSISSTGSASIAVGGGGFILGLSNSYASGASHTYTWSGITEQFDTFIEATQAVSGASLAFASTQTVSVSATPSAAASDTVHIFASWR